MTDDLSAYASVGKSFTLPTLTDMYGKDQIIKNTQIRPEVGMHYDCLLYTSSNYKDLLAKHANILDQLLLNLQKMRSELSDRINFLENTEACLLYTSNNSIYPNYSCTTNSFYLF